MEESALREHADWVRDVAWAPSLGMPSSVIASCSQDGRVMAYTQDAPGGAWRPAEVCNRGTPVWRVSWSVTGNVLAVSDANNEVTLWKEALDRTWQQLA